MSVGECMCVGECMSVRLRVYVCIINIKPPPSVGVQDQIFRYIPVRIKEQIRNCNN
jgi:hypothetical protein